MLTFINIFVFTLFLANLVAWSLLFLLILIIRKKLNKELDLGALFKKLIKNEDDNQKQIKNIELEIKQIQKDQLLHFQRWSIVKYNPFGEVGGENSFSLVLLNDCGDGCLLTGLHTRERTRLYLKTIKQGKSDIVLSNEEKKAIDKALSNKA